MVYKLGFTPESPEEFLKRLCLAGLMVVVYQNLLTLVSLKLVYNPTTAKFNWFKKKKVSVWISNWDSDLIGQGCCLEIWKASQVILMCKFEDQWTWVRPPIQGTAHLEAFYYLSRELGDKILPSVAFSGRNSKHILKGLNWSLHCSRYPSIE